MWFLFGVIAFLLSTVYFYNQRVGLQDRYRSFSTCRTLNNFQYSYSTTPPNFLSIESNKNQGRWLEVAIECETTVRFSIKPETKLDSFSKRLRLSIEPQTNNPVFDSRFYLSCESDHAPSILGQSELTNLFCNLLDKSFLDDFIIRHGAVARYTKATLSLSEIKSNGKYLAVAYKLSDPSSHIEILHQELAKAMRELSLILKKYPDISGYKWWNDSTNFKSAFLLSISSGFGLLGILEFMRLTISQDQSVVINYSSLNFLWLLSCCAGLPALAILVILIMKRSSRTHLILKDMLIVGGIGFMAYTYSLLYDLNMILDHSTPHTTTLRVDNKEMVIVRGKHTRTYYKLYLKDGKELIGNNHLKVTSKLYNQISRNDHIELSIKDGFLHATWIEQIHKCNHCK